MKIALCQISPVSGNVAYNQERITQELERCAQDGVHLAIFPELTIPGYPPQDLLEYSEFCAKCDHALLEIKATCEKLSIAAIVGSIAANIFGGKKALCNAAIYLSPEGAPPLLIYKKLLPTYDVFDEHRYFQEGPYDAAPLIQFTPPGEDPVAIGVTICEDLWNDEEFWKSERLYPVDPVDALVDAGAQILVNISSSPFTQGKPVRRLDMVRHIARRRRIPVIMVNQVGGNDDIIFDGGSCVALPNATLSAAAGWFVEKTVYWETSSHKASPDLADLLPLIENNTRSILEALTLGLRDYMARTGFTQALIGNSGGIDSAVVIAIAVHALGPENVISVTMPSQYTSPGTHTDANTLAEKLGIKHLEIPIEQPHTSFRELLAGPDSELVTKLFDGDPSRMNSIAEENIQARLRSNILMYISNAITSPATILLTTGNKSELAVGYCTLYGDMSGGLAILSDVPKMTVYRLANLLNEIMGGPIPQSIIDRAPSAELAPGQQDQDSLPPYPILDEIVRLYVEDQRGPEEIIATGIADEEVVRRTVRMIQIAEYKRAQAAPGLKVTSKAFGRGRRLPIARRSPKR